MKYKIEFNYRYGKDYVYCNEYREDEQFVQPLNSNGKPLCTIAKTKPLKSISNYTESQRCKDWHKV